MIATSRKVGCLNCGAPWPAEQLLHRQEDGTWSTTCVGCGQRQPWDEPTNLRLVKS